MSEWFESWFDSPYYHILYDNRNDQEASFFLDNLIPTLSLENNARILDLACGAGRHARILAKQGFVVHGVDLSQRNIALANKTANDALHFSVHDMRQPFPNHYAAVFNLFTSFGYFETKKEHEQVLQNIFDALNPKGIFVIDFLNAKKAIQNLVSQEEIHKQGITFSISREYKDNRIHKHIEIQDSSRSAQFDEYVWAFTVDQLRDMLELAGFVNNQVYGSYDLKTYETTSPRVIIVASKPSYR